MDLYCMALQQNHYLVLLGLVQLIELGLQFFQDLCYTDWRLNGRGMSAHVFAAGR